MLDNYCNYFLSLHVHYNPVDSEVLLYIIINGLHIYVDHITEMFR